MRTAPKRRIWFIAAATLVLAVCFYIATIPLGILYGKIPDPPASLLLEVLLKRTVPILAIGLISVALAGHLLAKGKPAWQPLLVLGLSLPAQVAMLYLTSLLP